MTYRIEISPTAMADEEDELGTVQIHRVIRTSQERLQDLSQILG